MTASKAELIEYCKRKLGSPLVEINMTDEQYDDAIHEALSFFRDYYFDGIEQMYFKHQVTQTDIDNKYITLPDTIFGVRRVFNSTGTSSAQSNIFDLQYQIRMNDLRDLTATSIIYYTQVMQHLDLLDQTLNTYKQFRWNHLTNKLYIDENWTYKEAVGQYIVIDCYTALDPADAPKYWDNRTLKHYATALMKKQWGANIKKFSGVTLPGGITLDGQALYEEGKQEAEDVETDIMGKLAPLEFNLG